MISQLNKFYVEVDYHKPQTRIGTLIDSNQLGFRLANFHVEHFTELMVPTLFNNHYSNIDGAVTKRKSEFLAGRMCAAFCLAKQGCKDLLIKCSSNRSPVWPAQYIGSITHSNNFVASAVASECRFSNIGIDIEQPMDSETATAIHNQIVLTSETSLLAKEGMDFNNTLTLIFSAKESIFKALYKDVGRYFDFKEAKLIACNIEQQNLQFEIVNTLSSKVSQGRKIRVDFDTLGDGSILTYVLEQKRGNEEDTI